MMNPVQFYEFGKSRGFAPNTFIGGVASTINTPTLLAVKLQNYPSGTAFSASNIKSFSIVGSDIQCYIGVDYKLSDVAFTNNPYITYFIDKGGKCFSITSRTFACNESIYLLKEIYLPECISINNSVNGFIRTENLRIIYLPKCVNYGSTTLNNNVFESAFSNNFVKIYANSLMQTINSGGVEGDLAYSITKGSTVRYVTNFIVPNPITDLSVHTVYATGIKLQWIAPSSVNGIDFYEIYVDGVFKQNATSLTTILNGLTNLQTYQFTVIAVDNFYNKSIVSNVVTQQINGSDILFGTININDIISYYNFNDNVLDSKGTNNGTATAITYASGKSGNAGVFNGTTSRVITTNNANLQLTTGSVCAYVKCTSAGSSYRGIVVKQNSYGLFLSNGVLLAYSWGSATGITVGDRSTGINLNDGLWHHVVLTFQLGVVNGTKIYIDGVLRLTTSIAVVNQTKSFVVGAGTSDETTIQNINGTIDSVSIFNKALSQSEVTEIYNLQNAGFELI